MSATENTSLNADLLRQLDEVEARVRAIRARAGLADRAAWKPLDDEEREALRERLEASSDVRLVEVLMTIHKVIEQNATGREKELCERATVVISTVLDRFAPEA